MDYYQDPLAHALLEVLPNHFRVLRWIGGRHAGVPEFARRTQLRLPRRDLAALDTAREGDNKLVSWLCAELFCSAMDLHDRTFPIDWRVQIVLCEIDKDLSQTRGVEELARLVNISPSRLCHLFKSQVGEPLGTYVKRQRLVQADVLLRTTTLRVKEVMNRVGINDASNFVKEFKKRFGVSPTMHRKMHIQSNAVLPV